MKTNIKSWLYTLIGCGALIFGTTACEEAPYLEVGSKWKVTEMRDVTFINGEEDYSSDQDLNARPSMYYYILSEEEIAFEQVGNYSEYASYFYDENTQLLRITYQYDGSQYSYFYEVIERTDNSLKLRMKQYSYYDTEYNDETGKYEIANVYFQYITLVKE